jgi:hypothetical protein
MAEQANEQKGGVSSQALLKIIIGVVLVILGIVAVVGWWNSLVLVFKGCIGLFLIMAGAITVAIARE